MNEFNKNVNTMNKLNMSSYDIQGRNFIAGLFSTREQAANAINALKASGFTDKQIGIIVRDKDQHGALLENTNVDVQEDHSGAAAGAVGGTLLGGLVGLILGTGAMIIPGVGPVIAGGVLAETIGMTALGAGIGAASGSLLGSLADSGMEEDEARYFESGFRTGSILVTVKATERLDEALEILVRNGGDVGNYYRSSAYRSNPSSFDTSDTTLNRSNDLSYDNDLKTRAPLSDLNSDLTYDQKKVLDNKETIQLREEELNINKHNEQVGEVVINKKVVEEMKTVEVPVTREEVIIERHKVNERATDSAIIDTDYTQEIRVPVMEEKVNVNKDTFVTEEISVEKRNVQDTKVVSENLKREEAVIQNKDDLTFRSDI